MEAPQASPDDEAARASAQRHGERVPLPPSEPVSRGSAASPLPRSVSDGTTGTALAAALAAATRPGPRSHTTIHREWERMPMCECVCESVCVVRRSCRCMRG
jgi:hypothetical protein